MHRTPRPALCSPLLQSPPPPPPHLSPCPSHRAPQPFCALCRAALSLATPLLHCNALFLGLVHELRETRVGELVALLRGRRGRRLSGGGLDRDGSLRGRRGGRLLGHGGDLQRHERPEKGTPGETRRGDRRTAPRRRTRAQQRCSEGGRPSPSAPPFPARPAAGGVGGAAAPRSGQLPRPALPPARARPGPPPSTHSTSRGRASIAQRATNARGQPLECSDLRTRPREAPPPTAGRASRPEPRAVGSGARPWRACSADCFGPSHPDAQLARSRPASSGRFTCVFVDFRFRIHAR